MINKALSLATVLLIFSLVSFCVNLFVNTVVIRPYMDEIFHIPQAQKYCLGNFKHWDPKITTPPGLYLLSVGLLSPLSWFFPQVSECALYHLRSINLLFAFGNLYLCFAILQKLNSSQKDFGWWRCALNALTLSQFPPLYFFTFLYYTDAGSTFTILLSYLLALHKSHFLAASIGAFAVLFRQTNIIWVAFFALLAIKDILEKWAAKELRKVDECSWKYSKVALKASLDLIANRRNHGYSRLIVDLMTYCGGYLAVGFGFVAFVVWNKGVVLGDHEAHRVTVHLPQLLYFCAFTLFFSFPILVSKSLVIRSVQSARKYPLATTLAIVALFAVVSLNTLAHPYLLADNRHYPFYVWRKFLGRHPLTKFLPIPVYLYAAVNIFESLRLQRGVLWTLVYSFCLAANVVPQELLEFRYFILPYLIFRLNLPIVRSNLVLAAEFLFYSMINVLTIYTFLMRPFVWPTEDTLQRFMW